MGRALSVDLREGVIAAAARRKPNSLERLVVAAAMVSTSLPAPPVAGTANYCPTPLYVAIIIHLGLRRAGDAADAALQSCFR